MVDKNMKMNEFEEEMKSKTNEDEAHITGYCFPQKDYSVYRALVIQIVGFIATILIVMLLSNMISIFSPQLSITLLLGFTIAWLKSTTQNPERLVHKSFFSRFIVYFINYPIILLSFNSLLSFLNIPAPNILFFGFLLGFLVDYIWGKVTS